MLSSLIPSPCSTFCVLFHQPNYTDKTCTAAGSLLAIQKKMKDRQIKHAGSLLASYTEKTCRIVKRKSFRLVTPFPARTVTPFPVSIELTAVLATMGLAPIKGPYTNALPKIGQGYVSNKKGIPYSIMNHVTIWIQLAAGLLVDN